MLVITTDKYHEGSKKPPRNYGGKFFIKWIMLIAVIFECYSCVKSCLKDSDANASFFTSPNISVTTGFAPSIDLMLNEIPLESTYELYQNSPCLDDQKISDIGVVDSNTISINNIKLEDGENKFYLKVIKDDQNVCLLVSSYYKSKITDFQLANTTKGLDLSFETDSKSEVPISSVQLNDKTLVLDSKIGTPNANDTSYDFSKLDNTAHTLTLELTDNNGLKTSITSTDKPLQPATVFYKDKPLTNPQDSQDIESDDFTEFAINELADEYLLDIGVTDCEGLSCYSLAGENDVKLASIEEESTPPSWIRRKIINPLARIFDERTYKGNYYIASHLQALEYQHNGKIKFHSNNPPRDVYPFAIYEASQNSGLFLSGGRDVYLANFKPIGDWTLIPTIGYNIGFSWLDLRDVAFWDIPIQFNVGMMLKTPNNMFNFGARYGAGLYNFIITSTTHSSYRGGLGSYFTGAVKFNLQKLPFFVDFFENKKLWVELNYSVFDYGRDFQIGDNDNEFKVSGDTISIGISTEF